MKEKNFSETRIDNAIKRLGNAKSKANQSRLDSFFTFMPKKDDKQTVNPGKLKSKQVSADKNKKKKGSKKK